MPLISILAVENEVQEVADYGHITRDIRFDDALAQDMECSKNLIFFGFTY
jgi:hypothetical protein